MTGERGTTSESRGNYDSLRDISRVTPDHLLAQVGKEEKTLPERCRSRLKLATSYNLFYVSHIVGKSSLGHSAFCTSIGPALPALERLSSALWSSGDRGTEKSRILRYDVA